jgi:hypothetical protein
MTKRQTFLLYVIACGLSVILSSMPDENLPRAINDPYDVTVYQYRGSWVVDWQQPYKDVFSEYPQLATYMFAIPHILGEIFQDTVDTYRYFFSLMMMVCLATTIVLISKLRSDRKYLAFLMFLPASLYFTHNRYDVVPAMFSLVSMWMISKNRFQFASFFLAISVMFKWYPVVLFPIFIAHYYSLHKRINWRMIAIFSLTIALIILPTILSIGWEGFLVPYQFHLERGTNRESIVFLFEIILLSAGVFNQLTKTIMYNAFLLLQVAIPFVSLFGQVRDKKVVLAWSSSAILLFMLFTKYSSPQWLLWILPFLIIRARTRRDILMIVLFDVLTYLKFPIVYDTFDHTTIGIFDVLIIANVFFLLYFIYRAFSEIYVDSGFAFRLPKRT